MRDSYYKEPMGEGMPSESSNEPDKDWTDNVPNSPAEIILKSVCNWWVKKWKHYSPSQELHKYLSQDYITLSNKPSSLISEMPDYLIASGVNNTLVANENSSDTNFIEKIPYVRAMKYKRDFSFIIVKMIKLLEFCQKMI